MDQFKFLEESLQKIWSDMVCWGKTYHFKYFKDTFHKFHLVHSWILCPIYPKDTFNISALILLMAFITGIKSEIRRGGLQVISGRNLTQYFTVECSIYSQIKVFKNKLKNHSKPLESWKTTLRKNYSKNVT